MLRKYAACEVISAWEVPEDASPGSLTKAAHRVEFEYTPRPGYLYVRSRMISSRCNDNWDEFPADEIAKSYETFLNKPAFVNHRNANHRRARGVIIRVALHEDRNPDGTPDTWAEGLHEIDARTFPRFAKAILTGRIDRTSMGCFIPGTPVTLADGTRKSIESVEEGDEVLTHTGKTEPVTFVMTREYDGVVYDVRTYGQSCPLVMTPDHPLWIRRVPMKRNQALRRGLDVFDPTVCLCGDDFGTRRSLSAHVRESKRRGYPGTHGIPDETDRQGWVRAEDVRNGDWVLTPAAGSSISSGSASLARLLGYYAAEGNLCWDRKRRGNLPVGVEWNFHEDEISYIDEIDAALHFLGYSMTGPYSKVGSRGVAVRCNSPSLADQMLSLGGQHSWEKRLSPEVMSWDPDIQRILLETYWNGDGHYEDGRVEASTASENLAQQLFMIAVRCGIPMTPPVFQHSPSARNAKFPGGRTSAGRPKWSMQAVLDPLINKDGTERSNLVFTDESGTWRQVTGVMIREYSGNVYNFDVDGDDSYVAADVAVHNCDVDFSKCSACGNIAADVADYCTHIPGSKGKKHTKYTSEGKRNTEYIREECFGLRFFENSFLVEEPADPTAVVTGVDDRGLTMAASRHIAVPHPDAQCPDCGRGFEDGAGGEPLRLPVGAGETVPSNLIACHGCGQVYDGSKSGDQARVNRDFAQQALDAHWSTQRAQKDLFEKATGHGTSPQFSYGGEDRAMRDRELEEHQNRGPGGIPLDPQRPGIGRQMYRHKRERVMNDPAATRDFEPDPPQHLSTLHEAAPRYPDPADHPWFREHPVSHLHVIRAFHDTTPGERASGASWYSDAHHVAKAIAGGDAALGAGVLSAYSPRTFWPANMFHASRSLREGRAIGPGEGANVMGMHQKPAQKIMDGAHWSEALRGPKTRAFAHLIEHGGESGDDIASGTGPVVVDRHAMSVAVGHRLSDADMMSAPLDHPHYYGHVARQYQKAAADLSDHYGRHIAPHEVQASTWLRQVRLNQAEDSEQAFGGKGRNTRNRNARDQWNQVAEEHHPSVRHLFHGKLWPRHTAITGESAEAGHEVWARPQGTSPVVEEIHRNMETREPGQSGETWYHGASYHGPYHIVRHPETRETHVLDAQGRDAGTHGSYGNRETNGTWGERSAEQHWHGLESAGPDRDRTGTREEPSFGLMKERTPAFEHSRIDPLDEHRAQRPDARVHKPEGYSPEDEYHGSYEVVKHPETGKFHVVDNAGRHAPGSGARQGHDTQMRAERSRDYIDRRQQSKEKAHGIAEKLFGDIADIFDPGGTTESRNSDRNIKAGEDLMGRYAGGKGKIKFDDDEEGGAPYYQHDHYLPNGKPSGWYVKHYGGAHADIYHHGTPDEAHDMIRFPEHPDDEQSMSPRIHPDFDAISMSKAMKDWHDDEDHGAYTRKYLEQNDPRIKRWKMRHQGARHVAYGETRVPPEVDTLRDEECPVCGEKDVFSGERCAVCGFVSPPALFKDPDLQRAKQVDLRQDQQDQQNAAPPGNFPGAPGVMPQDGLQVPGQEDSGQMPDAQQGSFPDADSQLEHPDQIAPDGVPGAIEGEQGADAGLPSLMCPACGFTCPAGGAVTETTTPDQPGAMGFQEGTPCPACGQGILMSSGDMQAAEGLEPGAQQNMGQEAVPPVQLANPAAPLGEEQSAAILGQQPMAPGAEDQGGIPVEDEDGDEPVSGDPAAPSQDEDGEDGEEPPADDPVDDNGEPMNRRTRKSSREGGRMDQALRTALAAQQGKIDSLTRLARQVIAQNSVLHAQLQVVGSLAGLQPEMAAIERTAALKFQADENNPASPVPDPPEQPAPESTEQALQPDAMDDPRRPGMTPGSVTNVPAMQTTTPLRPGVEDQTPPATNLIDVTAPVQGTNPAQDGGVPLSQRRIETDVRVGDPMNPEIAFPWNDSAGPDSGQDAMTGPQSFDQGTGGGAPSQRAASHDEQVRARMMGSMRLASLRLRAGLAAGDQISLAGQIERDASLSDAMMVHEIRTLTSVAQRAPRQEQRHAVQRTAATRAVPSLSSAPRPVMAAAQGGYGGEDDLAGDADLFM